MDMPIELSEEISLSGRASHSAVMTREGGASSNHGDRDYWVIRFRG